MEILKTFGFEWYIFIGQVVNFLILVYLFKRFMYKPILGVLKERENRIRQSLADAEKTRAMLEQTDREKDDILKKTRAEAQGILESTRKVADEMKQEIIEHSRSESEKIIAQAKVQAAAEMEKMQKQIKTMSIDMSQKIMANVLGTLFSDEEKAKVTRRAVEKITSEGARND